jgi:hypothetical protein
MDVAQAQAPPIVTLESHPEAPELVPKPIEPVGDANQEPVSPPAPVPVTTSPSLNQPQGMATPFPKFKACSILSQKQRQIQGYGSTRYPSSVLWCWNRKSRHTVW